MSCATRALVVAARSQHHNVQGCGPRSGYNARAVPSVGRPLGGRRAGQQPLRAAKGEPEANPAEGGVPPGSSGPTGGGGGGGGNGSGAAGGAILAGRALESLPAGGWGSGMTASDVASRRSFRPGWLAALSGMLNHHCLPARPPPALLTAEMAEALAAGKLPQEILQRFLEMEANPLLAWLMRIG
jgi:hypothetical protein